MKLFLPVGGLEDLGNFHIIGRVGPCLIGLSRGLLVGSDSRRRMIRFASLLNGGSAG